MYRERFLKVPEREREKEKGSPLTTRIPIGFNVVGAAAVRRGFAAVWSRSAYVSYQAEAERTWRSAKVDRFHLR